MRRERASHQGALQIPSERIGKVTLAIYHDETMAMTEQKTNRTSCVVAYCRVNTEQTIRRVRRGLTLMDKVMS